MIHGKITVVNTDTDEQMAEIETAAAAIADLLKLDEVKVEVEYPIEREPGNSWDKTGDALLVRFTDGGVEIETLPPYDEETP